MADWIKEVKTGGTKEGTYYFVARRLNTPGCYDYWSRMLSGTRSASR